MKGAGAPWKGAGAPFRRAGVAPFRRAGAGHWCAVQARWWLLVRTGAPLVRTGAPLVRHWCAFGESLQGSCKYHFSDASHFVAQFINNKRIPYASILWNGLIIIKGLGCIPFCGIV